MTNHKYIKDINKLDCVCFPDKKFQSMNVDAFRWVHSDSNNPNNFSPVFKITPSRIGGYEACEEKCVGFGLSLFISLNKAEKKLTNMLRRKPKLAKQLGDSIAEGNIDESDGLVNKPNSIGHFTLHENVNCNLKPKFVTVKQIKL
jgi:hypothetical protein